MLALNVLHLLLLLLIKLVVLIRIAESLVSRKLLLDHPLKHTVMWELLLHLEQLFADLPLIVGLCEFGDSILVQLCFLLLC